MHIYYDNTTFSLSTQLIILENNGKERVEMVKNNPYAVMRSLHKIIDKTNSTKVFIHIRG